MDRELIGFYFSKYIDEIAGCIPDLLGSREPRPRDFDTIAYFAADYIYNREQAKSSTTEIRLAGRRIAKTYC